MNDVPLKCDVGVLTETECHLNSYINRKNVHKLETLSKEDVSLLKFRISDYYKCANGQGQSVVNSILNSLNLPSVNYQRLNKVKRIHEAERIVQDVCEHFSKVLGKTIDVDIPFPQPISTKVLEDSFTLREFLKNLQKKVESSKTTYEKLQYLALLPKDWDRKTILSHFDISEYTYKKLSEFKEMDDNIKSYVRRKYFKISDEMKQLISNYFLNDENVYTYPGKRDYVSCCDKQGRKMFKQKRLLLYTLHDLYLKFKNEYDGQEHIPSFSFFASLKPEECIHAGDPGSHTICVCAQHQNVKLKLQAFSRKLNYRDLLVGAVCNVDFEDCMVGKCEKCPKQLGVKQTLQKLEEDLDIQLTKKKVKYKNWVDKNNSASLESFEENVEVFKEQLCEDINDLTSHHFVAETQKRYLNYCKNNLCYDTCIILMDFSENYSFIIQQSVQSFYYNNSQATIHPFCLYLKDKESDTITNVNYCVISDTKDHYAYTVNAFTGKLMDVIKEQYSWIKNVIYFSDGAPQQYKNKNHLANIMAHEKDFSIKVSSYNFFATSHGKSPSDAIGGSLKRQVMRHCIRSSPEAQITNAREMYEYAVEEAKTIKALWVAHKDVQKYERRLKKRFKTVKTFQNTRISHCYIPKEDNKMILKVTSFSTNETTVNVDL